MLYEQALRSLTTPSPSMASMLLRWIARTYEVDADYAAAEDCAVAAVATAELGDERNALGHALNVLAAVRWRQGDLDHAEQLFHEALERGTSTTDPRLQVDVMTNLGSIASIRGDFREALRYFQDALAHGRLYSLLDNIVVALNNLGLANMALGRLDAADEAFTEALTIANALGGLSTRVQLEVNCARRCRSRSATSPKRSAAATARWRWPSISTTRAPTARRRRCTASSRARRAISPAPRCT